jgi:outer membrane protein OmpA-like peptidoglycan-associated protein
MFAAATFALGLVGQAPAWAATPPTPAPSCTSLTPAINAIVTCTPGDYSITIPSGATFATVDVRGGGGGGEGGTSGGGGGGAKVTADLDLIAGAPSTVTVHAGAGGAKGNRSTIDGGAGGGWSGIQLLGVDMIIAGGGGGGSSDEDGGAAGAAVGATGDPAVDAGYSSSAMGGVGGGASSGTGGAGGAATSNGSTAGLSNAASGTNYVTNGGGVAGGSPVNNLNGGTAGTEGNGGGGSGYGGGGAGGFVTYIGGGGFTRSRAGGGGAGGSFFATSGLSGAVIATGGGSGGSDSNAGYDGSVIISFHAPRPTITSVSPASGSFAGGTSVIITGANYIAGTAVTFDGTAATSVVINSLTQITATTPAHVAGFVDVTVTSAEGTALVPLVGGYEYTTALPPAPTPVPDSGGGSSPVVEPTPTPTPTPSSTSSSAALSSLLDPIANAANPNIPTGGVPAGGSVYLVNGVPVPVTVAPDAKSDPTGLNVSGPGFNVRLAGRGDVNDPLGLSDKAALILQSDQTARSAKRSVGSKSKVVAPVAVAAGDGFMAESPVKFFLLPSSYMGELVADGSGVFSGSVPVPAGIAPGDYTLQMNGFAPDGAVRSLSIGVVVRPAVVATSMKRTKALVFFEPLSSQINAAGQTTLKALVKRTGKAGIRSIVVGFVQGTTVTANDQALSTERARAVASYLRSLGLKGAYTVRGDGVAEQSGASARRVAVTVSYRTT